MTLTLHCVLAGALLGLAILGHAATAQRLDLPPRPPDALGGTAFASSAEPLTLEEREARIVEEILSGNVPASLRALRPVWIESEGHTLEVWVTPDYLAIGSDDDRLLIPMTPQSAWQIADSLGLILPTPKLVDAIWAQADRQLDPAPIPPSPEMTTLPVFLQHSRTIDRQRRCANARVGELVAGHKKDVVLSSSLADHPDRVAIYGWHQLDGRPIQPLYLGHTTDWVDYSHGIRLVLRQGRLDGRPVDLWDVLQSPELARLVSDEGVNF